MQQLKVTCHPPNSLKISQSPPMLKPLLVIAGGAVLFVALGFLGAYLAGMFGALAGMVLGIAAFFMIAARNVGR